MRPLPLNLRDTYGHVRMAVYSAGLDAAPTTCPTA